MASAPQTGLPPFYNGVEPLSSQVHPDHRLNATGKAPHLAQAHAIPLTIEEFGLAQRFYPIVFASGANGIPLGLMGLNEGVNAFVDAEGGLTENVYVPAYARRYPFMLAHLRPDSDEMSLCFDPTSPLVGALGEGELLFVDGQPSETTRNILGFCEQFEQGAQRTQMFVKELDELDLLIEGELTIQVSEGSEPAIYRGFRMVSEDKLREMRGDQLRKLVQSGALALVYAHLLSLPLARDVYARQLQRGQIAPPPQKQAAPEAFEPFSF